MATDGQEIQRNVIKPDSVPRKKWGCCFKKKTETAQSSADTTQYQQSNTFQSQSYSREKTSKNNISKDNKFKEHTNTSLPIKKNIIPENEDERPAGCCLCCKKKENKDNQKPLLKTKEELKAKEKGCCKKKKLPEKPTPEAVSGAFRHVAIDNSRDLSRDQVAKESLISYPMSKHPVLYATLPTKSGAEKKVPIYQNGPSAFFFQGEDLIPFTGLTYVNRDQKKIFIPVHHDSQDNRYTFDEKEGFYDDEKSISVRRETADVPHDSMEPKRYTRFLGNGFNLSDFIKPDSQKNLTHFVHADSAFPTIMIKTDRSQTVIDGYYGNTMMNTNHGAPEGILGAEEFKEDQKKLSQPRFVTGSMPQNKRQYDMDDSDSEHRVSQRHTTESQEIP